MDPLHLQIYEILHPRRGTQEEDLIKTIAANITFLVKHTVGSGIHPSQISVPIIYVAAAGGEGPFHKVSVCVHRGVGKCVVVVEEKVEWGADVILGLTGKVDILVEGILSAEAKMVGEVEVFGLEQGCEMSGMKNVWEE